MKFKENKDLDQLSTDYIASLPSVGHVLAPNHLDSDSDDNIDAETIFINSHNQKFFFKTEIDMIGVLILTKDFLLI